jgi:hypothetical protein
MTKLFEVKLHFTAFVSAEDAVEARAKVHKAMYKRQDGRMTFEDCEMKPIQILLDE